MTDQTEMFPEIVKTVPIDGPVPCAWPYFIVAYYPRDKRWAIDKEMYMSPDGPQLQAAVKHKRECGWTNVTVMKLPASLWGGA